MYPPLTIDSAWQADIPDLSPSFDWDGVWVMVMYASRNPDHQQIHLNFIHRTYKTPRNLYLYFFHMIWDFPGVTNFWNMVKENMFTILNVSIPFSPSVVILNDLSDIQLNKMEKQVFLAGLTAAKKIVATKWKPPHSLKGDAKFTLHVTYMHLADAFIQSDLHCIQVTVLHLISSCFPWESNPWSWRC